MSLLSSCTRPILQVHVEDYPHDHLPNSKRAMWLAVEANHKSLVCRLDTARPSPLRSSKEASLLSQSKRAGSVSGSLDAVDRWRLENDGVESLVKLVVGLFGSVLIVCPPASCNDLITNARCAALTGVQVAGYEYAYPASWMRERIRGIEVLAHDPAVAELNLSITTGPVPPGALLGSAEEVGNAIITRFKNSPSINKAELLEVDLKEEGNSLRNYSLELLIDADGKQRHLLTKLIRTDRKVLSLTLQVPEELWWMNASCMRSVLQAFKATIL